MNPYRIPIFTNIWFQQPQVEHTTFVHRSFEIESPLLICGSDGLAVLEGRITKRNRNAL